MKNNSKTHVFSCIHFTVATSQILEHLWDFNGQINSSKKSGEVQLFWVSDMVHSPEFGHVSEGRKENFKKTMQAFKTGMWIYVLVKSLL